MQLHELARSTKRPNVKRVGRGHGAGSGKTAGRGQKGQKARSTVRVGFEGGQTPLFRRIPKFGFQNRNQKEYQIVTLDQLEGLANDHVTLSVLKQAKIIKSEKKRVKVLNNGTIKRKITLEVHAISHSAQEAIEAAKGVVKIIHEARQSFTQKSTK